MYYSLQFAVWLIIITVATICVFIKFGENFSLPEQRPDKSSVEKGHVYGVEEEVKKEKEKLKQKGTLKEGETKETMSDLRKKLVNQQLNSEDAISEEDLTSSVESLKLNDQQTKKKKLIPEIAVSSEEDAEGISIEGVKPCDVKVNGEFSFWLDKGVEKGASQAEFENAMEEFFTFSTGEELQKVMEENRSELVDVQKFPKKKNVRLFKYGISPLREHPKNDQGGRWMVILPKDAGKMKTHWLRGVKALLEGNYDCDELVNGIVFSVKQRYPVISIWVSGKSPRTPVFREELRSVFKVDANLKIIFNSHNEDKLLKKVAQIDDPSGHRRKRSLSHGAVPTFVLERVDKDLQSRTFKPIGQSNLSPVESPLRQRRRSKSPRPVSPNPLSSANRQNPEYEQVQGNNGSRGRSKSTSIKNDKHDKNLLSPGNSHGKQRTKSQSSNQGPKLMVPGTEKHQGRQRKNSSSENHSHGRQRKNSASDGPWRKHNDASVSPGPERRRSRSPRPEVDEDGFQMVSRVVRQPHGPKDGHSGFGRKRFTQTTGERPDKKEFVNPVVERSSAHKDVKNGRKLGRKRSLTR